MLSQSHSRPVRTVLAFPVVAALTLSLGAAPAAAVPAPNETVITVNPVVTAALQVAKIKVTPKGAAKSGSAGIYYPVTNATKMNDLFIGTLKHQGGFELKIGTLRVGFRNFIIKTSGKKTPITGVVDATPVINGMSSPFTMPMSTVKVTSVRKTQAAIIAKYTLAIDPKIAQLVNDTLKVKLFTPGDPWATVETRIKRATVVDNT